MVGADQLEGAGVGRGYNWTDSRRPPLGTTATTEGTAASWLGREWSQLDLASRKAYDSGRPT